MKVEKLGIVPSPLLVGFVSLFSLPEAKNNRNSARQAKLFSSSR